MEGHLFTKDPRLAEVEQFEGECIAFQEEYCRETLHAKTEEQLTLLKAEQERKLLLEDERRKQEQRKLLDSARKAEISARLKGTFSFPPHPFTLYR